MLVITDFFFLKKRDILSGIKADIFFCAIHCVKHDLSLARNCTSHLKALSVCCDLKLEL